MFSLLSQPYPSESSARHQWIRAAWIGVFIGLFLLLFQPFGLNLWQTNYKTTKVLGFGLITFLLTGINFTLWPRLLPNVFSDKHWTIGKEILLILANILTIALVNRFYVAALINRLPNGMDLASMIMITFLVGIFPTTGSVLANYVRLLRKYKQLAADLPVHSSSGEPAITPDKPVAALWITLVAENEKERLQLTPDDLLFIESSDNYCTVYVQKAGQFSKTLLRSSLSRLIGQLGDQSGIVRCHRSFVVNLDHVERVTGNAQGYKLHLANDQFVVPVARQYNDSLVAQLKS